MDFLTKKLSKYSEYIGIWKPVSKQPLKCELKHRGINISQQNFCVGIPYWICLIWVKWFWHNLLEGLTLKINWWCTDIFLLEMHQNTVTLFEKWLLNEEPCKPGKM